MTRSLLMNVISKSWDKKRRDWSSEPIPRVVTPGMLMATVCGCGDGGTTGFVASDETVEQQQEVLMRNLSNKMGPFYAAATNNDLSSENDQQIQAANNTYLDQKIMEIEGITSTGSKGSHSVSSMQRKRDNHSPEIGISHSQGSASVYSSKGGKGPTSPGRINLQGTVSGDRSSGAPSFDHDTTGSSDSMDVRQRHQSIGKSKSTSSGRSYGSGGYPNLSMRSDGSSPSRSPSSERVRRNGNLDHLNLLPSTSQENYHHSSDDEHPSDNKNDSSLSEQILQNHNSMNDTVSPPPSEMGVTSVCESNTTIPIANHSPKAFDKKRSKNKFRDRRKRWGDVDSVLRSNNYPTHDIIEQDEDFREGMVEMNGHDVENSSKGSKSSKSKKKDKKEKDKKEKKEKKRKGKTKDSIERIPNQQINGRNGHHHHQYTSKAPTSPIPTSPALSTSPSNVLRIPNQQINGRNGHHHQQYTSKAPTSPIPTSPALSTSPSNVSLEYSLDSATIASGQFDGGMSVGTAGTAGNQSLISCVTRSTIHTLESRDSFRRHQKVAGLMRSHGSNDEQAVENDVYIEEEEEEEEVIPTDEELYKIGWAKALDSNSGSYYYFSLDRSKIVWENPLIPSESTPDTARTFSSESGV
eukprot:CAMPEP_0178980128 /NCGR_PEP_ID=MMETSP0789-20121207/26300_1 /TAXON_ID=3005 /ORGANISM="Rhizosolenia setigera, Strain CCMP 1694" /LENGTH=635 /DNA_ID=CAMNT_0020670459 /DNA_START=159 /DNA_END=2067 /DNA_ORIENTATION=-